MSFLKRIARWPAQLIAALTLASGAEVFMAFDEKGEPYTSFNGLAYAPLVAGQARALTQPTWYVDAVNGDDANDGATPATALATMGEYLRRIGLNLVPVAQTVNLLSDITEDVTIVASYPLGLTIQGQRTVLYQGSATAAVAWDGTTTPVTLGTLTDAALPAGWSASGPGGSSLVGELLVMTSGANVGLTAPIVHDQGANVATIGQLIDVVTFATGAPAALDTFDVVSLTKINGTLTISQLDANGFVDLEDVEVVGQGTSAPLGASNGSFAAGNCIFSGGLFDIAITTTNGIIVGCLFEQGVSFSACDNLPVFNTCFIDVECGVSSGYLIMGLVCPFQSTAALGVGCRADQGGRLSVSNGGVVGVIDQTAAVQAGESNAGGVFQVASGSVFFTVGQTAGIGLKVDSVASAIWPTGASAVTHYKFDVAGPATEWDVGGVATTSAVLAGVGTITATNNAAAVPLS